METLQTTKPSDSGGTALVPVISTVSIFLLSFGSLFFEVVLTRLFSYLFVQNFVYLILSIGIAGIGMGAVVVFFVPRNQSGRLFTYLQFAPPLLAALLLGLNYLRPSIYISLFLTMLYFFAIGSGISFLFKNSSVKSGFLYAADLTGAAAGAVLSFFVLNWVGAWKALALVSLVTSTAFIIILTRFREVRLRKLILVPLVGTVFVFGWFLNIKTGLLPGERAEKEMSRMLEDETYDSKITESRWTAFGRVDLVESENPYFKTMFIDGAAGTKMLNYRDRELDREVEDDLLFTYMGGLPLFAFYHEGVRPGSALVLGSGGGIDIVTLLLFGYQDITAVEINKSFIDIVKEHRNYTGGIYTEHPDVTLVHAEGRSYIRNSGETYNLIHMSLPIIKSRRNFGNYALTENYLFTHNAVTEYRRALKPGGALVVVTHYPYEALRLLANVLKSFDEEGVPPEEALKRIAIVGPDSNPTIVVKKGEFTGHEVKALYTILEQYNKRGNANFIPGLNQRYKRVLNHEKKREEHVPQFHPDVYAMASGKTGLDDFVAAAGENISYISDSSPFFYQMQKFLPREVIIVLAIALVLIGGLVTVFREKTAGIPVRKHRFFFLTVFSLLGAGYILIEVRFVQKYIVYWSHQTLALAVVLAVVLLATGTGSLVSTRIKKTGTFSLLLGCIIVAAAGASLLMNPLLRSTETAAFTIKMLVTFISIFPVFFFMGLPFPYFLQRLGDADSGRSLYPWVIGANSITTLFGAVVSIAVAMTAGFPWVLVLGCTAYAAVLGLWLARGKRLPGGGTSGIGLSGSGHRPRSA